MEIKLQAKKKPPQKTAKANVFARPSNANKTKIVPTVDKKKNEEAQAQVLKEDPTAYEFDALYDDMKAKKEVPKEQPKSRYVQALKRGREVRDVIRE